MKSLQKSVCSGVIFSTLFYLVLSQRPCNLYCDENPSSPMSFGGTTNKGSTGAPGKRGGKGDVGQKGAKGDISECQCSVEENFERRIQALEIDSDNRRNIPTSCKQIQQLTNSYNNGIYYIQDSNGMKYPVYCDMAIDGGGWTLVASIHENNIRSTGRCSPGDRWSSEHGPEKGAQVGAENWMNYNTFGDVASATSDDYKSQAYFDLQARDVMIWQVPNDTPLANYSSASYLQYRTTNGFLRQYGGNLYRLYKDHFPIKSGVYSRPADNGPAIPVTFDKGNANEVVRHLGPNIRNGIEPGYIQFRTINHERSAYALCPGTRTVSQGNNEHHCIGSTADNVDVRYCGDFAGFSYDQYGTGNTWNSDMTLLKSTFFLFYR
ncbi:unnamed protein product [Clavelina lepadiformis]|uniref:Fibrinogen C-terminal domain-containing protein n=1 Tax=Clavelina lepadiformis TaxID=159417 RepID=A0ABP0GSN0_CLALP